MAGSGRKFDEDSSAVGGAHDDGTRTGVGRIGCDWADRGDRLPLLLPLGCPPRMPFDRGSRAVHSKSTIMLTDGTSRLLRLILSDIGGGVWCGRRRW